MFAMRADEQRETLADVATLLEPEKCEFDAKTGVLWLPLDMFNRNVAVKYLIFSLTSPAYLTDTLPVTHVPTDRSKGSYSCSVSALF